MRRLVLALLFIAAAPQAPVTHAAFDLTALAIIYWNLESTVAHLVFK